MLESLIIRVLRRILFRRPEKWYAECMRFQKEAASSAFCASIGNIKAPFNIHHPFYLFDPKRVSIGENFWAGPGLRLEAVSQYFGQEFSPNILIGNNVCINYFCHIAAISNMKIGDNVLIGSHVLITDHSHGDLTDNDLKLSPSLRPLVIKGPVTIERNVWIGDGARILSGVRIGENAVVGANAVVTGDVRPGTVVAGVPARELVKKVPLASS